LRGTKLIVANGLGGNLHGTETKSPGCGKDWQPALGAKSSDRRKKRALWVGKPEVKSSIVGGTSKIRSRKREAEEAGKKSGAEGIKKIPETGHSGLRREREEKEQCPKRRSTRFKDLAAGKPGGSWGGRLKGEKSRYRQCVSDEGKKSKLLIITLGRRESGRMVAIV